ncbi:MAG TPA: hypothetical protein PKJ24_11385 [Prolixibacteraceae bacterium]|nr:hypothetical protein [Prolixibacteraceae bacterium]
MEKTLFKEEQRFGQWWLWLLLIACFGVSVVPLWYGYFDQVTTGIPWGDHPASNASLLVIAILVTLLMVGILVLFNFSTLYLEVRENGVYFRFPPFFRRWKVIRREEIGSYTVGKYNPIGEYGGYGVRTSYGRHGKAYNVSGNLGMRLTLRNGKVVMIGTQRKQALEYAMLKMMAGLEPAK